MITPELIARINELARKKKTSDGLTVEEQNEQKELRNLYLKSFREGFKSQLDNIKFVDDDGPELGGN